jgi:ABC-type enterochelin transport system permease subunit
MKIENFDDALKRKLENVNTSYEESDIQRVHDYVTRNHTLGRVRNPKRSWILAGSSMIIAGLIMWNVILINQNRELHQTVNGFIQNFQV